MLSYFPLSVYTQFGQEKSPCILFIVIIECEVGFNYIPSHLEYH